MGGADSLSRGRVWYPSKGDSISWWMTHWNKNMMKISFNHYLNITMIYHLKNHRMGWMSRQERLTSRKNTTDYKGVRWQHLRPDGRTCFSGLHFLWDGFFKISPSKSFDTFVIVVLLWGSFFALVAALKYNPPSYQVGESQANKYGGLMQNHWLAWKLL